MPMHRNQPLPDHSPDPFLRASHVSRLQVIFKRAIGVALASTLASAACQTGTTEIGSTDADAGRGGEPETPTSRTENAPTGPRTPDAGGGGGALDAGQASPNDAGSAEPPDAGAPAPQPGAADAGSTTMPPTMPMPSPSVDATCEATSYQLFEGLTPATPYDYIAMRTGYPNLASYEHGASGTPCLNSTSMDGCEEKLAELQRGEGLEYTELCGMVGNCRRFFLTTADGVVRRYGDRQELLELLGEIDSPADAFLLITYDGFQVHCMGGQELQPGEGDWTSSATETPDGYQVSALKLVSDCPYRYARVMLSVSHTGEVKELDRVLLSETPICAGRRPAGWSPRSVATATSALGEHFAAMALLEAASVAAFEILAAELAHHGAPATLVEAARDAARDEVRHAATTGALARRFGACPEAPEVCARPVRGLLELALDNAVEGCVRETFGAAIGCYQAQVAEDAEVARLMREIAEDETRHAALAFAIDTWLRPQLSAVERAQVDAARRAAVRVLGSEVGERDPELCALAGLPGVAQARRLHDNLYRELWSA